MSTLRLRDLRKCSAFLHELYRLRNWDDLTTHVIGSIPRLIATDICSYNDMSGHRRFAAYRGWPDHHPTIPDAQAILGRYAHQHPIITHAERTKDLKTRKITDFLSQRQFRDTDLYNEFYRPLQLPYNMGAMISITRNSVLAIGLNRVKRDFADEDIVLLDLLRPHLVQAYANAYRVSTVQEQMAVVSQTLEGLDRAVMGIVPDGRILWATPRAIRYVSEYLADGRHRPDRLPTALRDWVKRQESALDSGLDLPEPLTPLVHSKGHRALSIRYMRKGTQRFLFLEQQCSEITPATLVHLGLSQREAEILSWVVQGKTNPEIGAILGISPRTVQKHLERVYSRLGVENRHAAMALVMETLQRGR
ncbi:MAG: helix-turn-helix transcriptional regulator [Nitrospira sp.]|nr:helix-turn-helix transcriptional regulator [Nitrospira sp.]